MDSHEKVVIILIIIAIFYMFVMPPAESSTSTGGFGGFGGLKLPFSFGFLRGKKRKSEAEAEDSAAPNNNNTKKKAAGKQAPFTSAPVAAPPRLPPGNARMTPLPAHLLTNPEIPPAT